MVLSRSMLAIAFFVLGGAAHASELVVYKTPWCGCCEAWADKMQEAGYDVVIRIEEDLEPVRQEAGVPDSLMGCHTAFIDGYVIEGHVPAMDIARLLTSRPDVTGIAVPGMPMGSPGMEMGGQTQSYQVMAFKDGNAAGVFAAH